MNVVEPSTYTECNSAAVSHNSQGVHAEPVASTSSECYPEVDCLNSQGIDHSEVAFERPLQQHNLDSTKANKTSTPIHKLTCDVGCQINTRGAQLMMKSTESQTYKSSFDVILCDQSTQTDEDFHREEVISSDEVDPSHEQKITPDNSPQKDPSYVPLKNDEMSDHSNSSQSETEDSKSVNPQDDVKFLVFKQELVKLFNRCPWCGAGIRKKHESTQGSQLFVTLKCLNGHTYFWNSQPMIKGMASGNLLMASSILLSGATYTKIATLGEILRLCFFSEKTFYNIQDSYLFPVINEIWEGEQNSVFNDLKDKELWLSGDGRCDSPGHNAKYGTYTMIDQHSNKIVDFHIVQVSEVTSSNAMEREGFKRCMENIQGKGAKVKVVATDRHVSIKSDMKRIYPDVDHQFHVWHLAKSVTKKLTEKAKKKDCGDIFPWIKSVSNHLWWCADTCNGDKELLREKWISIVHHTANIHQWDSADYYHECPHPPIPRNVARTKRWLRPGSPAHEALKEVVFDKNLLKDIQQLTLSCHTGSLEVYHSVQTKYLPKRQHFWYKGMVARTQLAALDHNANTSRDHATASKGENEGELRFKVVFPKRSKEWIAKPIMEKTTRDHVRPLVDAIVARKCQDAAERSATLTAPHIPRNIACTPRPDKAYVVERHTSRFSDT